MSVYAISDTHLSTACEKPMDIFGAGWVKHWDRIKQDWLSKVNDDDTVLISGDISWAMKEEDALPDLRLICDMPGKKVLIKGNHDYWHGSLGRTRAMLYNNTFFLQNDCYDGGDFVVAGVRGWIDREDKSFTQADEKIYSRELMRLKMSLDMAKKLNKPIIAMMHYPPYTSVFKSSDFTRMLKEYGVKQCVYGHIHGEAFKYVDYSDREVDGVACMLTSCDYLGCKLRKLF